jgi:integrase
VVGEGQGEGVVSFRYEKRLPGLGPIRKSTGLTDEDEIEEFKGLMVMLARTRPALIEMWVRDEVTAVGLLRANREDGGLAKLVPDPRVLVALWGEDGAFERVFRRHRKKEGATVRRYRVSAVKLQRLGVLPVLPDFVSRYPDGLTPQTVGDLQRVDWDAVAASWRGSPSDWMAFYRMLSHFLTLHFGGKRTGRAHPSRTAILDLLPRKREHKRVPAISPGVFAGLMARQIPEHARPSYYALAITGFRLNEYLALERAHLRPALYEIEVPGTKTEESAAVIPVHPSLWRWIDAAVPSPLAEKWLRVHWHRACLKEGLATLVPDPTGRISPVTKKVRLRYKGPTLHDLRHCNGQWATNAGAHESMVQAYLRHTDPATTRRYTMQQMRTEVAGAVARALGAA